MKLHPGLRYEIAVFRTSRLLGSTAVAVLALSTTLSVVLVLSSRQLMEVEAADFWAFMLTQGGTFGWPPLYAYVLAVLGVLVWRDDVTGDSALIAYTSFPGRWSLVVWRSSLLTLVAAALSVSTVIVALATVELMSDPPPGPTWTLLTVKTVWIVMCGVGFAQVGAALCMALRSTTAALTSLLVLPWLIEPLLVQLIELVPALRPLAVPAQLLPFRAMADLLGDATFSAALGSQVDALRPLTAAWVTLVIVVSSVVAQIWLYVRRDGRSNG